MGHQTSELRKSFYYQGFSKSSFPAIALRCHLTIFFTFGSAKARVLFVHSKMIGLISTDIKRRPRKAVKGAKASQILIDSRLATFQLSTATEIVFSYSLT